MSKVKLYIAAAVAASTGALFGYSVGFVGGLLVLPSFARHFHLDALSPSELARSQSLVVSSWIVGAFFGVPTGIPICSRLGRKACLMFSASMYVLGAVLQIINVDSALWLFAIGRFLNGYGVGAGTLVSPIYISEISTPSDRGMLMAGYGVLIQGSAVFGFWGAYAANASIANTSDWQWQIPVAIQLIPGMILLLGTPYIRESPHYLAAKGTLDQVENALSWFRGLPPSEFVVKAEARDISTTVSRGIRQQAIRKTPFIREALRNPIRKRLITGIGLFVAQNMSGMNALNYYVAIIFLKSFGSVNASLLLTGIFGFVKLVVALLFMFVCVRISGNRFWLLWGTGTSALSMLVLGYCVATMPSSSEGGEGSPGRLRSTLAVLSVYLYAIAFGVGVGPIAWNVCSEIFPSHLNAKCCAVTTCTQWLFQIVVAAITPILLATIGPMTFVFYGVCNLLGMVFYYFCVPETRGVALGQEMSRAFGQEDYFKDDGVVEEVEDVADVDDQTPLLRAAERRRRRSSIAIVV